MSAGKDAEDSNGQASSPVMVSAALGDQFAQALKDLARGEQTATTLEASLTRLEDTLDQLLTSMEEEVNGQGQDSGKGQQDQSKGKDEK
ncbi:hypothetical protein QBC32DRAFT_313189 [Pseudoneurospora amorphoporcata]|uniref:Uncharacterized protein n=1 Tax=Pseudoneurospora amorphoporcata TaxID=241081 RepID=A0AAN6NYA6_9PEZI|nr:hypothetical protein QBC32DRAFT_313189 [Pseudoneurospora amorphoporcata]